MKTKSHLIFLFILSFIYKSVSFIYGMEEVQYMDANNALAQQLLLFNKAVKGPLPLISEMKFDQDNQMTVTVGLKKLSGGCCKHACLVFESYKNGIGYYYEDIHLTIGGDPKIYSSFYGTEANIGEHTIYTILSKFVESYYDVVERNEKGINEIKVFKTSPEYEKIVSFIFKKQTFREIVTEKVKEDKEATADGKIKFSFVGRLNGKDNYNCCTYANKVLSYCNIITGFSGFSDEKFENSLIKYALIQHAIGNKDNVKLHINYRGWLSKKCNDLEQALGLKLRCGGIKRKYAYTRPYLWSLFHAVPYDPINLADYLIFSNQLKAVTIANSKLQDGGLTILSEGIKHNKSLTYLDISNNFITDLGLRSLYKALSCEQHAPLKTLILQYGIHEPLSTNQFSERMIEDFGNLGRKLSFDIVLG